MCSDVVQLPTAGPWVVHTKEHPHYLGGSHKEHCVITGWYHPQAKGPVTVVGPATGLGPEVGGPCVHLAGVHRLLDAELIADAPAMRLVLELVALGAAELRRHLDGDLDLELTAADDDGSVHVATSSANNYTALLNQLGWHRAHDAFDKASPRTPSVDDLPKSNSLNEV